LKETKAFASLESLKAFPVSFCKLFRISNALLLSFRSFQQATSTPAEAEAEAAMPTSTATATANEAAAEAAKFARLVGICCSAGVKGEHVLTASQRRSASAADCTTADPAPPTTHSAPPTSHHPLPSRPL